MGVFLHCHEEVAASSLPSFTIDHLLLFFLNYTSNPCTFDAVDKAYLSPHVLAAGHVDDGLMAGVRYLAVGMKRLGHVPF